MPGQDFDDLTIQGVFDVKSFGATPKAITTRLSFNVKNVDLDSLAHLAKRGGSLVVDSVEELEGEEEESEDEE